MMQSKSSLQPHPTKPHAVVAGMQGDYSTYSIIGFRTYAYMSQALPLPGHILNPLQHSVLYQISR